MSRILYDARKCQFLISAPFDIGPRLWPSLKLSDGSRVSITTVGRDAERRINYQWAVDDVGEHGRRRRTAHGVDLYSGVGADVDVEAMFSTFASFVGAWVEAGTDGENSSLFPESMRDWADANHEELYMLVSEDDS